ncbi:MAG TPA: PDZ domain-containing protein [Catenuloplanes sp.]|jgi:PDZ domain-containing protein
MKRRGVTVLLGALFTALLALGVVTTPIPYVVLKPGPTVDTLGTDKGKQVINITGTATSASTGQLRLTTVGVQSKVELLWAIRGWISDEDAVVPRELVYPPNQSEKQVEQRNAEDFKASQSTAETAALRQLGYPVEVTVVKVVPDGPSQGRLQPGDVITAVDGQPVTAGGQVTEFVRAKPAGTSLTVAYRRGKQTGTTTITSRSEKSDDPPRIGVEIDPRQPHPFQLDIELDKIGGPSAGLMFSLGIIDKLRPADLTGGRVIAGTGTIDDLGRVGPIGGIPQKLVGAQAARATVFLTPAGNCAEAVRNARPGLPLVKVATLNEALAALETLRAGGQPPLCAAP